VHAAVSRSTFAAPRTVVSAPPPTAIRPMNPNTSEPSRVARTRGRVMITRKIPSAISPTIPAPIAKIASCRSSGIPAATITLDSNARPSIVSPSENRSIRIVPKTASRGIRNPLPARIARAMSPRRAGRIAFSVNPIIR
jgi:hypothetical protein